ncbi:MAG: hypothetical protein K0R73_459 [Candidatus Midichloriaceae bacterium]|jgi:hypothetical protein|nr:hypothetical protein [Candidatus Midichloriaceae bacterium]
MTRTFEIDSENIIDPNISEETEGYRRVWAAVIWQAFIDAKCNSKKPHVRSEKIKAIKWLVFGGKAFEDVCLKAGLNAEKVRNYAIEILLKDNATKHILEVLYTMEEKSKSPDPKPLDLFGNSLLVAGCKEPAERKTGVY